MYIRFLFQYIFRKGHLTFMVAKLIKGTEIGEQILQEITSEVAQIKGKYGVVPGLVTILVGQNPA